MRIARLTFLTLMILGATMVTFPQITVKYQLTPMQRLQLEVKQRDLQIAQKDVFIAQQNMQTAYNALKSEADNVRTENGWPSNLMFDAEKIQFIDAPKPAPDAVKEKE